MTDHFDNLALSELEAWYAEGDPKGNKDPGLVQYVKLAIRARKLRLTGRCDLAMRLEEDMEDLYRKLPEKLQW